MRALLISIFLFVAFSSTALAESRVPSKMQVEEIAPAARKISFTLHNKSMKSIPLVIPSVMKPNLSPQSDSAVTLAIGQKIIYRYKGKRRVLLVVSADLRGTTLDVADLIQQKKGLWDSE